MSISERRVCGTKQIYLKLDYTLKFKLSRIISIAEFNDRKNNYQET